MAIDQAIGIGLLAIGVILLITEIIHPGAVLLIPGTILLAVGILIVLGQEALLSTGYGAALVVAVGFMAGVLTIPYYRYIAPTHRPLTTIPTSLEGEEGIVLTAVVPDSMHGKVRVRSEVWSARAKQPIPAGTRVRVLGGEGVTVTVEPIVGAGAAGTTS
jgi:inner membrane protein